MLFGVIFGDCITRRLHDHREIPKDRWNRQSAARHTAQAMPGVREGGRLCVCRHYVVTGGFLRKKNEQSANMKCGTNRAGLPRVATGAWAVDSLSSDNDGQTDLLASLECVDVHNGLSPAGPLFPLSLAQEPAFGGGRRVQKVVMPSDLAFLMITSFVSSLAESLRDAYRAVRVVARSPRRIYHHRYRRTGAHLDALPIAISW